MKATRKYIYSIAVFLAMLIFVQPLIHAEQLNLIYDDNGNLVTEGTFYREYNSLNQLVRIRNGSNSSAPVLQEFVHDPNEERIVVKKTFNSSGSVVESVYYFDRDYVRVDYHNGTVIDTEYIYLNGELVAQTATGQADKWIHTNHLGSVVAVTNSNCDVLENSSYEPYGSLTEGGSMSRFAYEGKEYNSPIENYDFLARMYNPTMSIFSQPDTIMQNIYNPQVLNHYNFELSNPYFAIDPSGRKVTSYSKTPMYQITEKKREDGTSYLDTRFIGYKISYSINNRKFRTGYLTKDTYNALNAQSSKQGNTAYAAFSIGRNMQQEYMVSYMEIILDKHMNLEVLYKKVFKILGLKIVL